MTTILDELIELGFNRNEAVVYEILLSYKKVDAQMIISKTKFHKNIVYDNLSKLIDKGLVSYVTENSKRIYQLSSTDAMVQFFDDKVLNLEKKRVKAKNLIKDIDEIRTKSISKSNAQIFRGKSGVKVFYNEVLKCKEFFSFGAPKESIDIMGDLFWKVFTKKTSEKNINSKLIFNNSIRDFGKTVKTKNSKIRYFEKEFEPLTETHIHNNTVAIIVWTEEPILFLIEDENVAKSYKIYFDKLWKESKI